MCVICYKSKSKKLPSKSTIEAMWKRNPDGAGIMWRTGKGVSYMKGFMQLADFMEFVERNRKLLSETEVAMHFRIGTHGGNTPGNTHPFIVDDRANPHELMGVNEKVVLMHNGILPLNPRRPTISDTAELALRAGRYRNPMDFLCDADELFKGNKVLVFAPDKTHFLGDEFKKGKDGLLYSNLYHEYTVPAMPKWEPPITRGASYDWSKWTWTKPKQESLPGFKEPEPAAPPVRDLPTPQDSDDMPDGWRPPYFPSYLEADTVYEKSAASLVIWDVAKLVAICDPKTMTDDDWRSFYESYEEDIVEDYEKVLWEEEQAEEEAYDEFRLAK
jgi:hypothetical protein